MENGAQPSDVVDPLANYWGISLFPQTRRVSSFPSKPYNPEEDLDAIHNHLRSMALQSPNKFLEQTESILDDNPGLLNSDISGDLKSDEKNDVVAEEFKECPRERRPALGLNGGRFSLKPTRKHSHENLIPSLDIDNLKDPVEFFLAHERLENAKREIQKQMSGVSFDPDQDNTFNKPRHRRPGLLGNNQRSTRYRHRYSVETSDNNDYVPSSQEGFESDSLDPVGERTDKNGACLAPLENTLNDSSALQENKLNDILDGLLSCDGEDLTGDGAITLLQERLQIKPVVLEKLSVPDFPDKRVIDSKSFQGNLSKPRKALSDIDNLVKGMSDKTPLRKDVGSPVEKLASPIPPKSPFASLSTLQKYISRSKSSVHPYSAHEIDHLSPRNSFPTNIINQELSLVNCGKPSNELDSHIFEDVAAVSKTSSGVNTARNHINASEKSKKDDSGGSSNKLDAPLVENIIPVSETSLVDDIVRNCASSSQISMVDNSREPGFDGNIVSSEPRVDMDVDIGGSGIDKMVMDDTIVKPNFEKARPPNTNIDLKEPHVDMDVDVGASDMDKQVKDATVGKPNFEANRPHEFEDKMQPENKQPLATSVPVDDLNFNYVNPQDQSCPAGSQADAMDECSRRIDKGPEQCLQEKTDGSMVPVHGCRRVKSRSKREPKDKGLIRRQSLAAAGSSWNSGLRRSTRVRTRPLEYWKGERLVFRRINDSSLKVIGVKCISPGSDGKPTMKVKSFVSDEYKEILELASLY